MSAAVVKLPTAAPRQVKQRWNKQTRVAREELPQFPKERSRFVFRPQMHRAMKQAQLMLEGERNAAMQLAMAMFLAADDNLKRKAEIFLCIQAESESARQALAWVRFENGSPEYKRQVSQALDIIMGREAE